MDVRLGPKIDYLELKKPCRWTIMNGDQKFWGRVLPQTELFFIFSWDYVKNHDVLRSIKGDSKSSGFKSVFHFGSLANSKLEIWKGSWKYWVNLEFDTEPILALCLNLHRNS